MKKLFIAMLMLLSGISGMSQQSMCPCDSLFTGSLAGFDFHGKFALKFSSDDRSDYYLLDFSRLPDRFTQINFLESSFQTKEIVNMGFHGLTLPVCYKASKLYPQHEILQKFDDLLASAMKIGQEKTLKEKEQWLLSHDKYK